MHHRNDGHRSVKYLSTDHPSPGTPRSRMRGPIAMRAARMIVPRSSESDNQERTPVPGHTCLCSQSTIVSRYPGANSFSGPTRIR